MLQLYDLSKVKIKGLRLYKDMNIESVLSSGDKTLSFLYPSRLSKDIKEECYIRTKKDEFVVKEISTNEEWNSIKATLNVEDLEGQAWEHFDTTEKTISQCLTLAVAGTGWTVQVNGVTKRRTIRKTNCSTWDIIQQAKKTYLVEVEFDTINKVVKVAEKLGADKGVYFMDSLNLRNLDVQSNSYDFYTRLIAIGKDDLKVTVENYQYSSKKKTFIWKDERYTDLASLREDATKKLDEISKPYRSYGADIIDLANINNKYSILAYGLGDTITLISKDKEIKEKQRIVKITEYPEEPHRNNCEIANSMLSFADIQKEYNDTVDTVTNITEDNGTISEGAIRTAVEHLTVNKLDVGSLNAVEIRVGNLEATKANITDLTAINASITILHANKANITDLTAAVGRVNILESNVADIKTLVNGNLTSSNIQSLVLSSDKVTVVNGFIKNAMIESLDVAKINAGDISVNKFRIKSDSGNLLISDNTIQIKDTTRVRVQIGKDASNDYSMYVWDKQGNLMFDALGLKSSAIKDKIIRDDMVSDNANIQGNKLNIASVVTSINNGATTINSSKVLLDGTAQTLNVAFNSLTTKVDDIEIGARNLVRDSKIEKSVNNPNYIDYKLDLDTFKSIIGEEIVISFDAIALVDSTHFIDIYFRDLGVGGATYTPYSKVFKLSNEYERYSIVMTVPDISKNTGDLAIRFRGNIYVPGGSGNIEGFSTKNIKIEKGNKATDWTPAPEDIDKSINNVKEITTSNTTAINVQQGKIDTLISNTTIVKDGVTTQLKDAYNSTVATVDSINSVISSHTSSINNLTGQITDVNTRTNEMKRTLDGTVSTVSSHTTSINGLNSTVNTQASSISQLLNQITLKVSQSDVNKTILNVPNSISGQNLIPLNEMFWEQGSIASADGSNINSSFRIRTIDKIRVKQNTEYILVGAKQDLQFGVYQYKNDGTYISNISWISTDKKVIKTSVDTTYIRIIIRHNDTTIILPSEISSMNISFEENFQEQITSVSDRTAEIETSLSGITSRVSTVEQTTSTLGGNVSSIDSRLNIAEQKITDKAIISTVSNTINTAKTDAIKTANDDTSNKLKDYSTTTQMNTAITQNATSIKQEVSNSYLSKADATTTYATKSSLTQTENSIVAKFESSGGYNLLKNSAFANSETYGWVFVNGAKQWLNTSSSYYQEVGDMAFYPSEVNAKCHMGQTAIKLKPNTKYTFSVKVRKVANCKGAKLYIDYKNGSTYVTNTGLVLETDNVRHSYTFTTPNLTFTDANVYVEHMGTDVAGNYPLTINKPCLCEGDVAMWSPHPSELIDGSTQIDANGVTIYNGAIDIRNKTGTSVLKGDSNGNLMVRGNLYADPANPILHLFGGCSLDATANNEQGVGSAIRLKWDNENYLRIDTSSVDIYQGGIARYIFSSNYLDCKAPTVYFANQCKIDASSGTFRFYISKSVDTGIRISPDGTVSFMVSGTAKHTFNPNGTKAGGTIAVDGATFGMSPIDSPKTLLEDVLFDIDVEETGTTVLLDSIFLRTISKYAVFCSNPNVTIVSKDRTSFYVKGYTGKVDFRIIGYRIGYEEQYYQLVG